MKIYCKLPHGISLELNDNKGKRHTIGLNGYLSKHVVAGFGVSHVDDGLWQEACRVYGDLLSGNFIFGLKNNDAGEEAKNRQSEKCGFERLNAAKPKLNGAAQGSVTPDNETNPVRYGAAYGR